MNREIVTQLLEYFKTSFGLRHLRCAHFWRGRAKNRLGHIVRFEFRGPTDVDLQKNGDLCLF